MELHEMIKYFMAFLGILGIGKWAIFSSLLYDFLIGSTFFGLFFLFCIYDKLDEILEQIKKGENDEGF